MDPVARARIAFCVLLSCLSIFAAEVLSGSAPWGLVNPGIFVLLMAVYGLHILVLGTLLLRSGRMDRWSLVTAGLLFGLYEAWITKVLWGPGWGGVEAGVVAGIYTFEMFWISFAWHVVMSFILPLLVAVEYFVPVADPSAPSRLTGRRARQLLAFFVFAAVVYPAVAPAGIPLQGVISVGVNLFVLALVITWYRREAARAGNPPLDALLPTPRQWRVLVGILLLTYVVFGAGLRTEAIPGPVPILAMVLIDGLVIGMLWLRTRNRPVTVSTGPAAGLPPPMAAPLPVPVRVDTPPVLLAPPVLQTEQVPAGPLMSPVAAIPPAVVLPAPPQVRFTWPLFGKVAGVLLVGNAVSGLLAILSPGAIFVIGVLGFLVGFGLGVLLFFGAFLDTFAPSLTARLGRPKATDLPVRPMPVAPPAVMPTGGTPGVLASPPQTVPVPSP